jgi:hypothetical protein
LSHEPIVLVADRIYIELEEPYELKTVTAPPNSSKEPQRKNTAPGFIDRILDNIKFEVNEIEFKVRTLGKHRKNKEKLPPSTALIRIRDIVVHSTNSKWQVIPPLCVCV